jgi:hypothetical protein
MKLSIEAIVAVAVAVVFAGLSVGAIAQEQSQHATGGPNRYGPTNAPSLSEMSARGFNSSSSAPLGGRSESQLLAQY